MRISDWSSDVCSSDLQVALSLEELHAQGAFETTHDAAAQYTPDGISRADQELMALKDAGDIPGFLLAAIQARKNLVISGATGSGKTTFARSLIDRVPVDERLVTIEDVHEQIGRASCRERVCQYV